MASQEATGGALAMGWEHVELALNSTRYAGIEKMVIVALCHHINKKRAEKGDTVVWPGMQTLIRITGWTKSPVQRAIDKLAADANPVVEIVFTGVGSKSTHYRIHLDRLSGSQELPGVVAESYYGGGSELPGGSGETTVVVAEGYPNQELELGREKKEINHERKNERIHPSADADSSSLLTNPKPNQPRPTLSTPQDSAAPSPISPRIIWGNWTPDQREAHFSVFSEEERPARKLESIFSWLTGKPSSWKDFDSLMTSFNVDGPYIASVITWAVNESSDGQFRWQFHNSKHFCKSTVWPVVAQQYDEWNEKKERSSEKFGENWSEEQEKHFMSTHGSKPSLAYQRVRIGL